MDISFLVGLFLVLGVIVFWMTIFLFLSGVADDSWRIRKRIIVRRWKAEVAENNHQLRLILNDIERQ
jgi:hypothetical protein